MKSECVFDVQSFVFKIPNIIDNCSLSILQLYLLYKPSTHGLHQWRARKMRGGRRRTWTLPLCATLPFLLNILEHTRSLSYIFVELFTTTTVTKCCPAGSTRRASCSRRGQEWSRHCSSIYWTFQPSIHEPLCDVTSVAFHILDIPAIYPWASLWREKYPYTHWTFILSIPKP